MSELREAILASLAGLLAISLVIFVLFFLGSSFTDQEIQESFVDTWEVNAVLTVIALCVVALLGSLAAILSWRTTGLAKRLALAAAGLFVLNVAFLIGQHAFLTERTTRLTGQEFGGLFGLGLGPI